MELKILDIEEIKPYANNPRINDHAVQALVESINQCGYIAPIIVDENNVILAGHTRYKALKQIKRSKVEVIVKQGLTEEQKRKYRLLDNKIGELANWDEELLEIELDGLEFGPLNLDWINQEAIAQAIDLEDTTETEQNETQAIHCPKCGFCFEVPK